MQKISPLGSYFWRPWEQDLFASTFPVIGSKFCPRKGENICIENAEYFPHPIFLQLQKTNFKKENVLQDFSHLNVLLQKFNLAASGYFDTRLGVCVGGETVMTFEKFI